MAGKASASPTDPSAQTPAKGWLGFSFGTSLSRIQAVVGTLAGIISIAGAVSSLTPFFRSNTGELVATVQDAASHRGVGDATIQVLTSENDVVATLSPDAAGRATQSLKEGTYVVRVSHPHYAVESRKVHVLPRQTVEVRANLHAGSSSPSPVERVIDNSVRAVRRALRF